MDTASTRTPGSCTPVSVTLHSRSGLLHIEWSDGAECMLPHFWLRERCRCAACTQALRSGKPKHVPAGVRLTELRPVADTGLNLAFSDGHDRGIYPWSYLRELADERARVPQACAGGSTS